MNSISQRADILAVEKWDGDVNVVADRSKIIWLKASEAPLLNIHPPKQRGADGIVIAVMKYGGSGASVNTSVLLFNRLGGNSAAPGTVASDQIQRYRWIDAAGVWCTEGPLDNLIT